MKLLKSIGFYALFLILIIFLCSLLNLIGVNSTITNLILFIFNVSLFLIYGFKNGIKSKEKGFLAGMKIASLLLLILICSNLALTRNFSISTIIYYIVLLLTGTFGGMLGISKKKEEN